MTISDRDKKLLLAIVPLVVVLGYWFLLLAPKREAAATAATELEQVQTELVQAQSQATTVQAAKTNFARDYAAVVALGKAIPTSVDMPSLLVQLEQASRGTGIEFDGVVMGERSVPEPPAAGGGAPAPGAAAPPAQSAPGQAAQAAQGAATAASTPPPAGATGTPPAPGDPAAAGTASPMGAADALETVALDFDFTGSFFELADFFHRLKRFVYVDGEKVRVRGRLMTIDAVQYQTSPETFPSLTAHVRATVFLSPKAEGTTAGATPTGPAPAVAGAAPVSTAGGGSGSPTPTATATP